MPECAFTNRTYLRFYALCILRFLHVRMFSRPRAFPHLSAACVRCKDGSYPASRLRHTVESSGPAWPGAGASRPALQGRCQVVRTADHPRVTSPANTINMFTNLTSILTRLMNFATVQQTRRVRFS